MKLDVTNHIFNDKENNDSGKIPLLHILQMRLTDLSIVKYRTRVKFPRIKQYRYM